jgi:hypothetical protein
MPCWHNITAAAARQKSEDFLVLNHLSSRPWRHQNGVRVPEGSRIFALSDGPERLWEPLSLLCKRKHRIFSGVKRQRRVTDRHGQERVDLYIHSPIRLHIVMLNYLSTRIKLYIYFHIQKTHSLAFSLRVNYTDRATVVGWRILAPTVCGVSLIQRGWPPQQLISVF